MSTKKQVKVTIEAMTPQALVCRSIDHPWDDGSDENVVVRRGRFLGCERHLKCTRCGYTKVQVLDADFEVVKTKEQRYPDGYLHSGGRLRKSDARREQARRQGYKVGA